MCHTAMSIQEVEFGGKGVKPGFSRDQANYACDKSLPYASNLSNENNRKKEGELQERKIYSLDEVNYYYNDMKMPPTCETKG